MLVPNINEHPNMPSIALIDLCSFDANEKSSANIMDYYFQLQRAQPKIIPIFLYLHELADERSAAFKQVVKSLDRVKRKMKKSS